MKKIMIILMILILTGCSFSNKKTSNNNSNGSIKSSDNLENKSGILVCTRGASAEGDIIPEFSYTLNYENGYILKLHSIEKVSSESGNGLKEYEDAYNTINEAYKKLDYYESKVIVTDNSVARDTTINYEKIDIEALLAIEGREDNIIDDNNKATIDKWLELGKKIGMICNESGKI